MDNYFAYNLKYLRKNKGLGQNELAKELNVARSTVSCWENGLRLPKIEMILKIAKLFDMKQDIIGTDIRVATLNASDDELITKIEKEYGVKITIQKKGSLNAESIQAIIELLNIELKK